MPKTLAGLGLLENRDFFYSKASLRDFVRGQVKAYRLLQFKGERSVENSTNSSPAAPDEGGEDVSPLAERDSSDDDGEGSPVLDEAYVFGSTQVDPSAMQSGDDDDDDDDNNMGLDSGGADVVPATQLDDGAFLKGPDEAKSVYTHKRGARGPDVLRG